MKPQIRARARSGQRGSVAVEFGLVLPFLLFMVLSVLAIGVPWATRSRLADATRRVTRDAAIARLADTNTIRGRLEARMAGTLCTYIDAQVEVVEDARTSGTKTLRVTGSCSLEGHLIMGFVTPDRIQVVEEVPFRPLPAP